MVSGVISDTSIRSVHPYSISSLELFGAQPIWRRPRERSGYAEGTESLRGSVCVEGRFCNPTTKAKQVSYWKKHLLNYSAFLMTTAILLQKRNLFFTVICNLVSVLILKRVFCSNRDIFFLQMKLHIYYFLTQLFFIELSLISALQQTTVKMIYQQMQRPMTWRKLLGDPLVSR